MREGSSAGEGPGPGERPIGDLVEVLTKIDAEVEYVDKEGYPPLRIRGKKMRGGFDVTISAETSSQFVSALLLAAPRFKHGLHLVHTGDVVPSPEHVAMTVSVLRRCGVEVDDSVPGQWRVSPGPVRALDLAVEPDLSNAGPFLAAAVVTSESQYMHLAAALGRPHVAIYGAGDPRAERITASRRSVMWLRLECSPCFARECPLGHFRCMKEISVEQVLKML